MIVFEKIIFTFQIFGLKIGRITRGDLVGRLSRLFLAVAESFGSVNNRPFKR
jgi:hypothetical protein